MKLIKILCFVIVVLFTVQSCWILSCGPKRLQVKHVLFDTSLLGDFVDDYNIRYTVTSLGITQHPGVKYNFISYNEKEQYFIARNDTANISDGGLYTRIDIMRFSNMEPWRWGFCLTAYKAASAEEAEKTAAADRANPKKGCGGYPFSRMKRVKN